MIPMLFMQTKKLENEMKHFFCSMICTQLHTIFLYIYTHDAMERSKMLKIAMV